MVLHSLSSKWSPVGSSYQLVCFFLPSQEMPSQKSEYQLAGMVSWGLNPSSVGFSQLNSSLNSWGHSTRQAVPPSQGFVYQLWGLSSKLLRYQGPNSPDVWIRTPRYLSLKLLNSVTSNSSLCSHNPEGGNCFLPSPPPWYFPLEFHSIKTSL